MMEGSLEVFLSCSQEREDRILRKKLEMQLGIWVQKGLINIWHKDKVHAEEEAEPDGNRKASLPGCIG